MTKERAISILKRYRRDICARQYCWSYSCRQNRIKRCACKEYLVSELIHRIRIKDLDPIDTVSEFIFWIESVLEEADEDHRITEEFIRVIDDEACDIERMLLIMNEKENPNEEHQLETGIQ